MNMKAIYRKYFSNTFEQNLYFYEPFREISGLSVTLSDASNISPM